MIAPFDSVSLLGFGAFGRLVVEHLAPHTDLLVHDPDADANAIRAAGATPASPADAARAPAIILAVPVQAIPETCRAIAPHLSEGTLVADVASVKIRPTEWMAEHLPAHARILGTHPCFGPQTAAELGTIAGQPIALCPVRVDGATLDSVRGFLAETLGLSVVETTPDEHDRQMALVQAITHLIGHAAHEMDLPDLPLATTAYRRLLQMKANTGADAPDLYDAIQRLNPHAADARERFAHALEAVRARAAGGG